MGRAPEMCSLHRTAILPQAESDIGMLFCRSHATNYVWLYYSENDSEQLTRPAIGWILVEGNGERDFSTGEVTLHSRPGGDEVGNIPALKANDDISRIQLQAPFTDGLLIECFEAAAADGLGGS